MQLFLNRYIRIALANLLVVSSIGVLLRYKIAFSLPWIDQKHLLHGHSHFAFAGWISHLLICLLVNFLARQKGATVYKKYRWMINANLVSAYGMLISFALQGYGLFSISFSTFSIFISYAFAVQFWRDLNRLPQKKPSHLWMKAALLFNALSSLGAFSLAFMMATKLIHQNLYLAAIYFFLHFQYNGWFLFASMGLATDKFLNEAAEPRSKKIFWLFAAACIPAYLLSALWLPMPGWLYIVVVLAAFSQALGWVLMIRQAMGLLPFILPMLNTNARWILLLPCIALSIKLLLQLGSTIPFLSNLAFGFRPIVIGYLHLILLAVISLFLLGFMIAEGQIMFNKTTLGGIRVFIGGVILNELLLMVQGIAAISYSPVPFINELLLGAALVIFTGVILLNASQQRLHH